MRLQNRTAIITGGSRGIGAAIAVAMAREGARVVVASTTQEGSEKIAQTIREAGGEALAVACDVTKRDQVQAMVQSALGAFGRLDILVNNAGITRDASFLKMTEENWDAVMNTNLKSVYYCCQAALPHMAAQQYGRIINISSLAGLSSGFGQANYAAAKAGVIGLTKSLAFEFAKKGISVNAIAPGFTETDMTSAVPTEIREKLLQGIPAGRGGKPEEVAAAAVYLASEEAGFVNGNTININGGIYFH